MTKSVFSALRVIATASLLLMGILAIDARNTEASQAGDGKLRIIAFGAHPDDCELQVGGTAAMWAAKGHHVKLVSVTNGDIGHWREAGGPLAMRRKREVEEASRILGSTVTVIDNHEAN